MCMGMMVRSIVARPCLRPLVELLTILLSWIRFGRGRIPPARKPVARNRPFATVSITARGRDALSKFFRHVPSYQPKDQPAHQRYWNPASSALFPVIFFATIAGRHHFFDERGSKPARRMKKPRSVEKRAGLSGTLEGFVE
jgi:hypothetical protein